MLEDSEQGGEAPCWAHIVDDLDQPATSPLTPLRALSTNTIIYCDQWSAVVDFYRIGLGLRATMERDWFIEFELHPGAHISVADARHTTIAAGNGSGLTLSWQVDDAAVARASAIARGLDASPILRRWEADTCFLFDPAGNRIELWSPLETPGTIRNSTVPSPDQDGVEPHR